jgi:hypothetical protein
MTAVLRAAAVSVALLVAAGGPAAADLQVERGTDRVTVTVDGKPFTAYVFAGHRKPILFPVIGPGGAALTRSWPLVEGVAGEPHDHPHHESLWFTHGDVNGADFWASHPAAHAPKQRIDNRVEHVELVACVGGPEARIETRNKWVKADGTVVCVDSRTVRFAAAGDARTIDYAVTIHADHGPVTFGDTKEGTFGLRVPVTLQTKDANGSRGAAGHILDSEGRRDAAVWGKAARWVAYWGPVDGRTVGVAIGDHPANLRHPSHWHARDYGLVAANPFGLHDFTGAPQGSGNYTLPAGKSLTFRYLVVLHEGDPETAGIERRWKRWADATRENRP